MDIFWSIAGLFGTVFFGVLSIILAVKASKKNKIAHVLINSYDVGKGLMDEFPKFKLNYDNKKIEKNIIVLKGVFINGGKDIKSDDISFELILPLECHIVDVNIICSDNDLKVVATNNDNKLMYKVDNQLLSNDFFIYSALIESSDEIDISDKICIKHRMYNTSKITSVPAGRFTSKYAHQLWFFDVVVIIFTACIFFYYEQLKFPDSLFNWILLFFGFAMGIYCFLKGCLHYYRYKIYIKVLNLLNNKVLL